MRTHPHHHTVMRRHLAEKPVAAVLHAPRLGEDIELFSDRVEDAVEYDVIMRAFGALHDAEIAADAYNS